LGAGLADQVIKAIDGDWANTVFGFIPNTAEVAYYGMMSALRERRRNEVKAAIMQASKEGNLTEALLDDLICATGRAAKKLSARTSSCVRLSGRRPCGISSQVMCTTSRTAP